jgi:hypothetical protein
LQIDKPSLPACESSPCQLCPPETVRTDLLVVACS